eukprot:3010976-Pyramimonas_sp.AAC.2
MPRPARSADVLMLGLRGAQATISLCETRSTPHNPTVYHMSPDSRHEDLRLFRARRGEAEI